MLKRVIFVNYGDCGSNRTLKNTSKEKIRHLADLIGSTADIGHIALVSSPFTPALLTAQIIQVRLRLAPAETHDCLRVFGGEMRLDQRTATFNLIDQWEKKCDTLVVSTHMVVVDHFPSIWGRFKGHTIAEVTGTPFGAARVLDLEKGEVTNLP